MANLDTTIENLTNEIKKLDASINSFDKSFTTTMKDKFTGGSYSKRKEKLNDVSYYSDLAAQKRADANGATGKKRTKLLKEAEKYEKESILASKEAVSLKKAGMASATKMIGDMAVSAAGKITDLMVKMNELAIKERQINLKAASKSLQIQTALYGGAMQKTLSVASSTVIGDLKDATHQAMSGALDIGKESFMANISLRQIEFEKNIDTQTNTINKQVTMMKGTLGAIGEAASAIPNPISMAAGALISIGTGIFAASKQMEIAKLNFAKEQMEFLTTFKKDMLEQAKGIVDIFVKLTNGIDKILMDLDNNAHTIGRGFGFAGEQLDLYVKSSAQLNVDMAKLGKTYEDLMKSQQAYVSASGRNVLMNGMEGQQLTSLDMLFNLGEGESAQLMGAMNLFNTSIESGSDMMFEMYKTANKMGVSNQKFAKDLQKNLKLAEKYQFKGGVEGMMKMSLWAQKVRFNMDSLSAALDKMHTGNIEDVIQTSARLNVLGGNAGILSDPMAMLYNAYADPEQYAKNMQQMVAGFGHFNSKTGETEFNINEQMRMEAMASAMGVSKEEFFNMARQTKKEGVLKKEFGGRFNKDQMDLLTQHATYDRDNKEWVVNVMGKDGQVRQKSVNDLDDEDLKSIFPEDTQKQLVEYTKGIFSLLQGQRVIENTNRAEIAAATQGEHKKQTLRQQAAALSHNTKYRNEYVEEVIKGFGFQSDAFDKSLNMAATAIMTEDEEGRRITDEYYDMSLNGMDNITQHISDFNDVMKATMDGNTAAIIETMYKLNPEAAANVAQAVARTEGGSADNRTKKSEVLDNALTLYKKQYGNRITGTNMDDKTLDDIANIIGSVYNVKREGQGGFFGMNNWRSNEGWIRNFLEEGYGYVENGELFWANGSRVALDDVIQSDERPDSFGGHSSWNPWGHADRVNDLIISPKHGIFETDPEDTITASKPGGSLDRAEQRRSGTPENLNLTVNGTLTLSTGKQSIDLLDVLRNDPNALRELAKEIIVEGSRTTFGGKHQWAPNRYTFGS